jgi:hypothetical protein
MAESQGTERRDAAAAESKLLTLSEVSHKTNISMPTLQRYKKTYQDRIPSVGSGRKQRYPEHSLAVFEELRSENASKRGRPRKNAAADSGAAPKRGAAKGRRAAAGRRGAAHTNKAAAARRAPAAAATRRGAAKGRRAVGRPAAATRGARAGARTSAGRGKGGLLTLTQISKTTGISYPTLVRYVRLYADRLPHEGEGRSRRFYPEAVAVFRSLREASGRGGRRAGSVAARRGRPPKAAATGRLEGILQARIRDLEKFQQAIEKRFGDLVKGLQRLR